MDRPIVKSGLDIFSISDNSHSIHHGRLRRFIKGPGFTQAVSQRQNQLQKESKTFHI